MWCDNCEVLLEESRQLKSTIQTQRAVIDQLRIEIRVLEQEVKEFTKDNIGGNKSAEGQKVTPKKRKKYTPIAITISKTEFPCFECDTIRYYKSAES